MDWNIFASKPAAPAPTPTAPTNTQATQVIQSDQGNQSGQTVEPNQVALPDPQGLSAFKDLFKPMDNANENNFDPSSLFNIDPSAIAKQVGQMNFSANIPQELYEQAAQGGEAGIKAMTAAMNNVAQNVVAQQTVLTAQMIQQALGKSTPHIDKRVGNMIRDSQISSSVQTSNAMYSDPAVAPIAGMVRSQLTQQYPNESPQEIAQRVNQYFAALAQTLGPKTALTSNPQQQEKAVWTDYFTQ